MAEKNSEVTEHKPDNTLPLRAALSNIFGDIGESVSLQQFAECQNFLRSRLSESKFNSVIHKLHETIGKDLQERMNDELEAMMAEESLTKGLGRLKQLVTESPYDIGQVAWRPPGDVELHLRTFDVAKIDEETSQLTKLVEHWENENKNLVKTLSKKRQKTHTIDKKIAKTTTIGVKTVTKLEKTRDCIEKNVDKLDNQMDVN